MNFLKRHYEKLVLAGFLLLFVVSMSYLSVIMRSTGTIRKEELRIPTRQPDFVRCDKKSPEFDLTAQLFGMVPWTASSPREGSRYQNFYSDLVVSFGAARCGHEDCEQIIPIYYFGNKKEGCPWCKKMLAEAPKGEVVFRSGIASPEDPDGCGIPHLLKEQYGLSTEDPGNVLDDLDGDGFSNLYEYRNKTMLNQAASHPPLWHRLVLLKIERVKLNLQLKAVMVPDPDDKTRWDVQINMLDTGRTKFTMLNDRIKVDDVYYTIKDIVLVRDEKDANGNIVDKSYIDMVSDNNLKIRMQIGKDVYTPDAKALIKDLGTGRVYTLGEGQEFRLGNRATRQSKYIVKEIDRKEKKVILQEGSGRNRGKLVDGPVTSEGKIPAHERVRQQNRTAVEP